MSGTCPLCERDCPSLEQHHLRTRRTDKTATEAVCPRCHDQIHALFSHQELRDPRLELDTIEGLLANERMQKAIAFIRKQPPGAALTTRQSRRTRKRR